MKLRSLSICTLLLLLLPGLAAAQSPEEIKFRERQADKIHDYAEYAFKRGFPLNAKRVWLMLLSEYDPNHAEARKALGYQRAGDSWALDPKFVYPREDKPDARAASSLRSKWERLAKKLATAHGRMADDYAKAGRTDMARYHYEKVLFFVPDDEDAQKALNHKPVAGLTGTDLEQRLYDRSKKIERIIATEMRKNYQIQVMPDTERHPLLDRAKVTYKTVQSEHFTVRGDFEVELLKMAAEHAERAIRVMHVAYEGYDGFNKDPKRWLRDVGMFKDKDTYKQILKANADLMDPKSLAFMLESSSASSLYGQGAAIRVSAAGNEQGILDGAVRHVATSYAGFRSPALREGIGHTFVGMFFNNNRQFVVDRMRQVGTRASEEDLEKYSPNFDAWKDLALEAAWKLGEGTPAAHLPVIEAAKFPDDARIKSWSFCDYVVRRDPTLLKDMDQYHNERSPVMVERKFAKAHDGLSIAQLEKEWKDFWTEASPVLKAIRNNTPPLDSVSRGVKKWISEFNAARKDANSTEVTWSSAYSSRCKEHVDYLVANKDERGPAREQTQSIDLEGGSHLGSMFAQMALVCTNTRTKPKKLFEQWLAWPGYRDALIVNTLRTIGLYEDDGVLVIDAVRGLGRAPKGREGYRIYPGNQQRGVPTEVKVEELGPEIAKELEKHGKSGKKVLGYPITLHFGHNGVTGSRDSYQCQVLIRGKPIEGFLHFGDGGFNRRSSAPGLVVFYPWEPLPRGKEIQVVWSFAHERGTSRSSITFNT